MTGPVTGPETKAEIFRVTAAHPGFNRLLHRHHARMRASSPEGSCHVLDEQALIAAGCTVLACQRGAEIVGVGAIRAIDADHAELKSMHSAQKARGTGVGRAMLGALLDVARAAGHRRISLETGSAELFAPARALYAANGFETCPPFGNYEADPSSVFMARLL